MEQILLLSLLVLVASAIGTFSGFGIATIMMPVLLLFFPLSFALLFVSIVHWFGDVWKVLLFRQGARKWKLILWFAVPGIFAGWLGATISFSFPPEFLLQVLGAFLLLYAAFLLFNPKWRIPQSNTVVGIGGLLSGFTAGVFGVGGEIRGAALAAFNLPKKVYLFTAGFAALFIDSTRIVTYLAGGTRLEGLFLWGLLLFIPLSFVGAFIAKKFVNRIPQQYFRFVIALFLALAGLKFLVFP